MFSVFNVILIHIVLLVLPFTMGEWQQKFSALSTQVDEFEVNLMLGFNDNWMKSWVS